MPSDEEREAPRSPGERSRRELAPDESPEGDRDGDPEGDRDRDAAPLEEQSRSGSRPAPLVSRRIALLGGALGVVAAGFGACHLLTRFPPDTLPEGAYLRIAYSMGRGDLALVFPYLEDEAQHACFTIRDYRKQALDLVDKSYPEPDRTRLINLYKPYANAPDGSDVWVDMATKRGFVGKLRRDLSGIAKVEVEGERATIETARGTRYAFRRRQNGIWGLTLFTADLSAEAERTARDLEVVKRAEADYARVGK